MTSAVKRVRLVLQHALTRGDTCRAWCRWGHGGPQNPSVLPLHRMPASSASSQQRPRHAASRTSDLHAVADAQHRNARLLAVVEEPIGHAGGAFHMHAVGPARQDDGLGVDRLDALLHRVDRRGCWAALRVQAMHAVRMMRRWRLGERVQGGHRTRRNRLAAAAAAVLEGAGTRLIDMHALL